MKRENAYYKYRDEKGTIFFVERNFGMWLYSYYVSGIIWHESEWHNTRRECKSAISERFGKIISLTKYLRGKDERQNNTSNN